ncbi:MAG: TRAP transporter TatT component family protein [Verrucomicrobia bacterium]|nr:TRAP transporter TatT component family protein [Verrucomicrobiota bacterium]
MTRQRHTSIVLAGGLFALVLLGAGCSTLRHSAVNQMGDALAEGGTAFASDDDPELVRTAAPFSLKLIESLLAENPRHRGLRLAAASGFAQYAFAFIETDAEEKQATDVDAALALRQRARRMYLRARDHALAGLAVDHPDFAAHLRTDPAAAVAQLGREDVPLAYWAAVSWAGAIAVLKTDPELIADLPLVDALATRALALDEAWNAGAIHGFFIRYELVRPGGSVKAARAHFERARELSDGHQAAPYVALAESVAVVEQNRAEFEALLHSALVLNADADPDCRLANLIMQQRARRLLAHADDYVAP